MNNIYMWLGVILICILIESLTAQLLTIWFIAGGVVALGLAWLNQPMWVQLTGFLIVSLLMFVVLFPILKKSFSKGHIKTNLDAIVGKEALVIEEINNILGKGRVIESGVYWTAKSVDDTIIKEGSTVRIKEISGAKLLVEDIK